MIRLLRSNQLACRSISLFCRRFSNVPSIRPNDARVVDGSLLAFGDQRRFASLVFADDATLRATPVSERVLLNTDRAAAASGGLTHVEVNVDEVRVEFQLASSPAFRRWASLFCDVERGYWPPIDDSSTLLVPKQVLNRTSWGAGATVIFGRKQMQSHLTRAMALLSAGAPSDGAELSSTSTMTSNSDLSDSNDAIQLQERLRLRWLTFTSSRLVSIDETTSSEWFETIADRYNETHRAYHTLTHINSMLTLMDSLNRQSVAIELATWFHDVIYDPTRSDNEEQSAVLFEEFARRVNLSAELATRVRRFIVATAKHRLEDDLATDADAQLFLDLDLSILAAPADQYDAYARGIRVEYKHVPSDAYLKGRPQVLRSLTSKAVFVSELFHTDAFESAAKANVQREIDVLESGSFLECN